MTMSVVGLHTISDLSPDGIVYINEQHRVEYVNPAFSLMTGFLRDELLDLEEGLLAERILTLCDNSNEPRQCDISSIENTEIMLWHAPTSKLISCTPRLFCNERGGVTGRVLYFHDITREKDRDQQVKSEFIAKAAHKLRTPLVGILGFSELLLKSDFDQTQQKDAIATIYRQATNFKQLLDDFLDIERLDARKGKDFRISTTTLEKIFDDVSADKSLVSDEVSISWQRPGAWPVVQCDIDKIKQAFTNLVSNSIKYSIAHSKITCSTDTRSKEGAEEFGMRVADEGVGMSPEELARVGERFYRVDNSQSVSGSGLGIALVREIVNIHQGSFEIESVMRKGTTATIWLPIYSD